MDCHFFLRPLVGKQCCSGSLRGAPILAPKIEVIGAAVRRTLARDACAPSVSAEWQQVYTELLGGVSRWRKYSQLERGTKRASDFSGEIRLRHKEFSQAMGQRQRCAVLADNADDHCEQNKKGPSPGASDVPASRAPLEQTFHAQSNRTRPDN